MANIIAFFLERPKGCWHLPVELFALRDSGASVVPLETEGRHVESQSQGTPGKEMPAPPPPPASGIHSLPRAGDRRSAFHSQPWVSIAHPFPDSLMGYGDEIKCGTPFLMIS